MSRCAHCGRPLGRFANARVVIDGMEQRWCKECALNYGPDAVPDAVQVPPRESAIAAALAARYRRDSGLELDEAGRARVAAVARVAADVLLTDGQMPVSLPLLAFGPDGPVGLVCTLLRA